MDKDDDLEVIDKEIQLVEYNKDSKDKDEH